MVDLVTSTLCKTEGIYMTYELERIKQLCHERGWSLYRLAHEMNGSPNNIYNIFHRTTTPSVPTLRQVCKAFGITLADFYAPERKTEVQNDILCLFNKLSPVNKARAEAYMLGLMDRQ